MKKVKIGAVNRHGSGGSTTIACAAPSVTSHRWSTKSRTTGARNSGPGIGTHVTNSPENPVRFTPSTRSTDCKACGPAGLGALEVKLERGREARSLAVTPGLRHRPGRRDWGFDTRSDTGSGQDPDTQRCSVPGWIDEGSVPFPSTRDIGLVPSITLPPWLCIGQG